MDLTLSDDDEPVRPAKKVAYSTPNSLPDPSRRYQLPPLSHSNSAAHSRPSATALVSQSALRHALRLSARPPPHLPHACPMGHTSRRRLFPGPAIPEGERLPTPHISIPPLKILYCMFSLYNFDGVLRAIPPANAASVSQCKVSSP